MHTDHRPQYRSPQDHAALFDAARAQARLLRRAAVDAGWAAVARWVRRGLQAARQAMTGPADPAQQPTQQPMQNPTHPPAHHPTHRHPEKA